MKYRREIDGLRAVAVLPVILFHAGFEAFNGGFVGVDIFFVISGYLITTIILADKEKGTFSLVKFYERRARRIMPALFFVMLCCIPFAWLWLTPGHMEDFSESLVAVSSFASNILFWRESGYFATAAELKPLLHTWSLAVEEQYYVLFPLFLMLLWKLRKRWIFGSLVVIAVASLTLAQWGAYNKPSATFYLLPARGWELAIGALIAFYLLYKKKPVCFATSNKAVRETLGLFGLALICYSIFAFDKTTPFPSYYALMPTIGTGLIIAFTTSQTLVGRLLGTKAMVGVGLISYSAYLWHQPLFVFARHRSLTEPSVAVLLALSVLSIVFAYLSWRYVEMPFRNRETFNRKNIFCFATVGSVAFIAIGLTGHLNEGFAQRYPQQQREMFADSKVIQDIRQQLIRFDECQYNGTSGIGVDNFLQLWDCYDDEISKTYTKIPIAITGDSHSADMVVALKQQGLLPLQIGGAGCSLTPSFMTKDCKRIFEHLREILPKYPNIEHIALANRFNKEELSIQSIGEALDYWEGFGKKLILFTSMPEFTDYEKRIFNVNYFNPSLEIVALSERRELLTYLRQRNVLVVTTSKLFCESADKCSMVLHNDLLLTDADHLSKKGAAHVGSQLVEIDPFKYKLQNLNAVAQSNTPVDTRIEAPKWPNSKQ